jgi:hypothetical protein
MHRHGIPVGHGVQARPQGVLPAFYVRIFLC